jgi:phosphoglycolate phosphatase-like HAD superfamily hydrolase
MNSYQSNDSRLQVFLKSAKLIFWDFDGVIKDSIEAKKNAFVELFKPFGPDLVERIATHHLLNGGISRFVKIPLYLSWAGEVVTDEKVKIYCDQFSVLVTQAVIDSPWVYGVQDYLLRNFKNKSFILISATPQTEIQIITEAIGLAHCFREVYGSPNNKAEVVADILKRLNCRPQEAIVVGDAEADLKAAKVNSVPFLLRVSNFNLPLQMLHDGYRFERLEDE